MTIRAGPRGNPRHDVSVKINTTRGNDTAVIGVRPAPLLIAGRLSADDERAVADRLTLNADAIAACLHGDSDTPELVRTLKPLSSSSAE